MEKILQNISIQKVIKMFDLVSDVVFWIKDDEGRIVFCNDAYAKSVGMRSFSDVVGKTDVDLFPAYIAKNFILDDKKVLKGEVILNRLEINSSYSGDPKWVLTSKRPLRNENDCIIGTYGVARNVQETVKNLTGVDVLHKPITHIHQHFASDISITDLANASHLSVSALERRFKKYLQKTPKQFIREVRLEKARKLLVESQAQISDIAQNCGFTSHSYFSQHFKSMFGELPAQYRQKMRKEIQKNKQ
ncbi:helix-turn-helix domain-containing protein [Shewanella gaetbuli]|uniref:Helix-turn-helix domain-containing protein n=1 Tax=Shewanella gaetbuli TaxID=220752 RepID=A0A9X2CIC5_9GAMM|nr:helix-turn-helix domain-containing protein [Shewanella gaetbuli]MCL1142892.1 helix-turn-helix domain-containing protein [Shewanella gaetbuli]